MEFRIEASESWFSLRGLLSMTRLAGTTHVIVIQTPRRSHTSSRLASSFTCVSSALQL
jgi:hypothetical protein